MTDEDFQREICRVFEVTPQEIGVIGVSHAPELADKEHVNACGCGDTDPSGCMYLAAGYPWCRPCDDHHRAPECAVDGKGRALALCGCAWDDVLNGGPGHTCAIYRGDDA